MPLTYRITTLGCRVNHAETRDLESVLRSRGLVTADRGRRADLEVIHTCCVTSSASAKSRHAIRRAARRGRWPTAAGLADTDLSREGLHGSAPIQSTDENAIPYSNSQIIVTGCFASTDPEEAERLIGDASAVIGHDADRNSTVSDRFASRVDRWLEEQGGPRQNPREAIPPPSESCLLPWSSPPSVREGISGQS